jgi:hypothetical protein
MAWTHELNQEKTAPAPVTLPTVKLEAAAKVAVRKAIRAARDAYDQILKAESFEAWCRLGAGLAYRKRYALRVTGANRAWGRNYSRAFSAWMKQCGFGFMRPSDRSNAIELHENFAAITAWREHLPERERRRLIGAQANVKRWRKETRHDNGKCPQDLKREAKAAWRRFVWCLTALGPEAEPLRQRALAEIAARA